MSGDMHTYEVRCHQCGDKKWPVLPEQPAKYLCVLCRAVGPAEWVKRRATGERAALTKKARQGPSRAATGAPTADGSTP